MQHRLLDLCLILGAIPAILSEERINNYYIMITDLILVHTNAVLDVPCLTLVVQWNVHHIGLRDVIKYCRRQGPSYWCRRSPMQMVPFGISHRIQNQIQRLSLQEHPGLRVCLLSQQPSQDQWRLKFCYEDTYLHVVLHGNWNHSTIFSMGEGKSVAVVHCRVESSHYWSVQAHFLDFAHVVGKSLKDTPAQHLLVKEEIMFTTNL